MTDDEREELSRLRQMEARVVFALSHLLEDGDDKTAEQLIDMAAAKLGGDEVASLTTWEIDPSKCDHEWRDPLMHETPCDMSAERPQKVCALCGKQRG